MTNVRIPKDFLFSPYSILTIQVGPKREAQKAKKPRHCTLIFVTSKEIKKRKRMFQLDPTAVRAVGKRLGPTLVQY